MFESVLVENYAALFDGDSVLIKCRLAVMLGYYADNLFHSNNELFMRTIEFLLKGIAEERTYRALALQCADTLKTAIGDTDLVSRLDTFINKLFPLLCDMAANVDLPAFYEILMTIISCYATTIDTSLVRLLESLVRRVDKEYRELRAKGQKNNMTINQCWNVIRAICEQVEFFPMHTDAIENSLLPMFNYLVDPTNIDFDDDMLQVITSLITKRGSVSPNMAKIFPFLPNFFEKYSRSFGSLLQTINCYIYYGKELFAANKEWIELVIKLFAASIYSTREVAELNNTEGAILAQMLLQSVGGGILDPYIPVIIEQTLKRLETAPMADYLARELYNVILCAICNNAQLTLNSLETQRKTETVFGGIFTGSDKYQNTYDIKVLAIGLANVMIQPAMPAAISKSLAKVLELIVTILQRQAAKDTKTLLKADKKSLALEGSDSDSDSGEEEDDKDEGMADSDEEGEKGDAK